MTPTPKVGIRTTRQRTAVMDLLSTLDHFCSAQDIHQQLTEAGTKIGLTTVYRTLQSMTELNTVDVLRHSSGETLYRACRSELHHHHLVCVSCGRTEEIDGGPVEAWAAEIARRYGFSLSGHDAEVYGLCPTCQAAQATPAANQTTAPDQR